MKHGEYFVISCSIALWAPLQNGTEGYCSKELAVALEVVPRRRRVRAQLIRAFLLCDRNNLDTD